MSNSKVTLTKSTKYPCKLAIFSNYNCILDSDYKLNNFQLAYQTYGELNKERSNAILIFHALTGDQFIAETHPLTKKDGWWNRMVGPKKPIDTNKYFVIGFTKKIYTVKYG